MADSAFWMIVPGNVALSAILLFVIAMQFLYAARTPVHNLVHSVGHLASGPLRLVSRWLLAVARDMRERNRQVLLAHGREETTQHIAREFERECLVVRQIVSHQFRQARRIQQASGHTPGKCRTQTRQHRKACPECIACRCVGVVWQRIEKKIGQTVPCEMLG